MVWICVHQTYRGYGMILCEHGWCYVVSACVYRHAVPLYARFEGIWGAMWCHAVCAMVQCHVCVIYSMHSCKRGACTQTPTVLRVRVHVGVSDGIACAWFGYACIKPIVAMAWYYVNTDDATWYPHACIGMLCRYMHDSRAYEAPCDAMLCVPWYNAMYV